MIEMIDFDWWELHFIDSCIADRQEKGTFAFYGIDKTYLVSNVRAKIKELIKEKEKERNV
jgi:hypothetical protein